MAGNKDKTFKCDECGKHLCSKSSLKRHVESVHKRSKPFKCEICSATFKILEYLRTHVRRVHEKRRIKCTICNKLFPNKSELRRHLSSAHSKARPFKCERCGYRFKKKQTLLRHIRGVHLKIRRFKCERCGQCFLKNHHLARHKQTAKPFKCQKCLKYFCNNRQYVQHYEHCKNAHTSNGNSKRFVCQICKKYFDSLISKQRHVRLFHGHKKPIYTCKLCGKEFTHFKTFISHINKCSEKHDEPARGPKVTKERFKCDYCSNKFSTAKARDWHMKVYHRTERPCADEPSDNIMCYYCKKFMARQEYLNHYKNCAIHVYSFSCKTKKTYICDRPNCKFATLDPKTMNCHRYKHIAEKDCFLCLVCGTSMISRNDMKRHVSNCQDQNHGVGLSANEHELLLTSAYRAGPSSNDESPFKCVVCGMECKCKTLLFNHVAQFHHQPLPNVSSGCGDNPQVFDCKEGCDMKFLCLKPLAEHMLTKHNMNQDKLEKSASCRWCGCCQFTPPTFPKPFREAKVTDELYPMSAICLKSNCNKKLGTYNEMIHHLFCDENEDGCPPQIGPTGNIITRGSFFTCKKCGEVRISESSYLSHLSSCDYDFYHQESIRFCPLLRYSKEYKDYVKRKNTHPDGDQSDGR